MQKESNHNNAKKSELCPIDGIMSVISKKWALPIIGAIGNSPKMRFNRIMETLGTVSPKTLSDRLRELEKERIIYRQVFAEIPPRVEYSLTQDGKELRDLMLPLMKWASEKKQQK